MDAKCGDWDVSLSSYETSRDGKVHATPNTFEFIIQNHFLSYLTTFLE